MKAMERQAQKIIKQHLSMDDCDILPSYEDVRNKYGYTGYMNVYLRNSKNDQSMSSSADLNVVLELAQIDQFSGHKIS